MEELTTEQKAQRYDEALKVAKGLYAKGAPDSLHLERMFPVLKESEDEKMRKKCIHFLELQKQHHAATFEIEECIAWLEKQSTPQVRTGLEWVNTIDDACDKRYAEEYAHGEYCHEQSFKWGFQEGVDWLEKQGGQKSVDKVEPKFHAGEWIVENADTSTWLITRVFITEENVMAYNMINQEGRTLIIGSHNIDYHHHLWTIKDAKPGDVLADKYDNIGFFKECEGIYWDSYIYLGCDGKLRGFSIGGKHEQTDAHPATKEQRDAIMKAMADAGWEFDFNKKELKKIEQNPTDTIPEAFEKCVEQLLSLSDGEGHGSPAKVKEVSLKLLELAKIEQKPAEWSEEDKVILNNIIWGVHMKSIKPLDEMDDRSKYKKYEDFLKSLPSRFSLRPKAEWSEEDEKLFNRICDLIHEAAYGACQTDEDGKELGEYAKMMRLLKSLKSQKEEQTEWNDRR